MFSGFVPLVQLLRPAEIQGAPAELASDESEATVAPSVEEIEKTLRTARRFRAALADALDSALESLLRAIAQEVLGRELQLAPAEILSIARAALESFRNDQVLRIRGNPRDLGTLDSLAYDAVADQTLEPGEIRIELRSGTIHLTLDARIEAAIAACVS
jgi:flagellar biosynthesis/type III secretory pathway protein FliH